MILKYISTNYIGHLGAENIADMFENLINLNNLELP